MTQRSRIFTLMAQREASELASARRAFAHVVQEYQAAESMSDRLTALMDQKREQIQGSHSVADLRQNRHMSAQLAAEVDRNRQRAAQMQAEIAAAQIELNRKKHRKQTLDDAAQAARKAEAEEREQRREAMRIPPPRR